MPNPPLFLSRERHQVDPEQPAIMVEFNPVLYPQLIQAERLFQTYELDGQSPVEATYGRHFTVQWIRISVGPGYTDFPYRGDDSYVVAAADDDNEEWMLRLVLDSVPLDPTESLHEGLLKVTLEPYNHMRFYSW